MKELFKGCWTIPNLISFIRILLVPLFAYLFMQGDLSCISDGLTLAKMRRARISL